MARNPDAKVISLGIGDTTEPIPEVITAAMEEVQLKLVRNLQMDMENSIACLTLEGQFMADSGRVYGLRFRVVL